MAYVNPSSSFRSLDKFRGDDGFIGVKAMCLSGVATAGAPRMIAVDASGYVATALAANLYGYVGFLVGNTDTLGSGSVATFQIGGYYSGAQASAAGLTGTVGAPVFIDGGSLMATSTATSLGINGGASQQVGVCIDGAWSGSTTGDIFLIGNWVTDTAL